MELLPVERDGDVGDGLVEEGARRDLHAREPMRVAASKGGRRARGEGEAPAVDVRLVREDLGEARALWG